MSAYNFLNQKPQFTAASFFTSFKNNEAKPKFGIPIGLPSSSFLQSPSWQVVNTKQPSTTTNKNSKKQQNKALIQQAMYILPKSPSDTSIYLQLPKFGSLSVLLRCGHVSQLVENWLRNPMDQLKKNAKQYYQPVSHQTTSLRIMSPSSGTMSALATDEKSLVSFRSSLLSFHFQVDHDLQTMEIGYDYIPCLFTVVCVTYDCGSITLSINQIESLDFLLSATTMGPFLVKCDLSPSHPVDIHRLDETGPFPLLCDYANDEGYLSIDEVKVPSPLLICNNVYPEQQCTMSSIIECTHNEKEETAIVLYDEHFDLNRDVHSHNIEQPYLSQQELEKSFVFNEAEYMHLKETMLYNQEEEDDESCIYSSSEEYSVLGDHDTDHEEYEKDMAQIAFFNLVRDTLEYIQSSGGALSDELNNLEYKLYNYSRAAATSASYD